MIIPSPGIEIYIFCCFIVNWKQKTKNVYDFNFITLEKLLTKNNFYNSVSNKHKIASSLNWSLSELLGRILYAEWEESLIAAFWAEARRCSFEWHDFGG